MEVSEIKEIVDVFSGEKAVVQQMLALSEQKKTAIIGEDVESLERLLESEEALACELGELEQKRTRLAEDYARRHGLTGGKVTLLQIAETAEDPETKKKLHALRAELTAMIQKQERCNRTNCELLERKMSYIDLMLGMLTEETHLGETYNRAGRIDGRCGGAGLFDLSV